MLKVLEWIVSALAWMSVGGLITIGYYHAKSICVGKACSLLYVWPW